MFVRKTAFIEFSYFEEDDLLKVDWQSASKSMSEKDFREQIHVEREIFLKYKPKKVLGQTQKLDYPINPDLQSWHNLMILPVFKYIKLEKLAIVTSENFFVNLSVRQILEDDEKASYKTWYFENEEGASKWLNW